MSAAIAQRSERLLEDLEPLWLALLTCVRPRREASYPGYERQPLTDNEVVFAAVPDDAYLVTVAAITGGGQVVALAGPVWISPTQTPLIVGAGSFRVTAVG